MEKSLHLIWYQGLQEAPPELKGIPNQWARLNPEYQVKVWDKNSIDEFIRNVFPSYYTFFANIGKGQDEKQAVIKKCDFARLLILFKYGGGYIDLDCRPLKPLRFLFEKDYIEHVHTKFHYSKNATLPTNLDNLFCYKTTVDFSRYELILSREHCFNTVLGGWTVANTVMFAKAGSQLIGEMVISCMANVREKVLAFAGPLGLSRYLIGRIDELKGRVLTLPPYYFLWQEHDMGAAWKNTICYHDNRMDWTDKNNIVPWDW